MTKVDHNLWRNRCPECDEVECTCDCLYEYYDDNDFCLDDPEPPSEPLKVPLIDLSNFGKEKTK